MLLRLCVPQCLKNKKMGHFCLVTGFNSGSTTFSGSESGRSANPPHKTRRQLTLANAVPPPVPGGTGDPLLTRE